MKPFKLYLLTGASIGALASPLLYTNAIAARRAPTPTSVVVVNTAAQPVPTAAQGTTTVAGTVNVGNTPTVNVGNLPGTTTVAGTVNVGNTVPAVQSGTWNVNASQSGAPWSVSVTGTPGVQVTNTPSTPVPTCVIEWRTPVTAILNYFFTDGLGGTGSLTPYVVPNGKRLFVKHVSGAATLFNSERIVGCVGTKDGSPFMEVPFTDRGTDNGTTYSVAGGPVDFEADSGSSVDFLLSRTVGTDVGAARIYVSGYLEPMP
ncbi:MAG: hypothetical protein HYR64_06515 [Fimbriimonas ginsengisoli]|uniref:Bacterial Ig domain-containing protein n=1 Tax=Fimbriimonas ginsengisoli TaxID=1005039 RepID=A0A931LSP3_FIMGI|nr:hypothetical protein [Fimbriimonas ginsengisoli]